MTESTELYESCFDKLNGGLPISFKHFCSLQCNYPMITSEVFEKCFYLQSSNDQMSKQQFCHVLKTLENGYNQFSNDKLLFKMLNSNDSGLLHVQECTFLLQKLGYNVNSEVVSNALQDFAANGEVNYGKFMLLMNEVGERRGAA